MRERQHAKEKPSPCLINDPPSAINYPYWELKKNRFSHCRWPLNCVIVDNPVVDQTPWHWARMGDTETGIGANMFTSSVFHLSDILYMSYLSNLLTLNSIHHIPLWPMPILIFLGKSRKQINKSHRRHLKAWAIIVLPQHTCWRSEEHTSELQSR